MKHKSVLITGANGYIALHLARMLKVNNYRVFTAGRHSDADFLMDFSRPSEIASMEIGEIDAVVHTVSPNEGLYKTDPLRALSENAAGIHAVLEFCKNNNIKDFIYFSSFHVFGVQEGRLIENTIVAPRNNYGLAHYTAEQTVQMFNRTKQVNGWIIRPSNLFGVPADLVKFKRWNLIPFLFCKEAVENNTITLLTPGHQLRNFVGVSDVCKQALWILEQRPEERIFHAYGNETMSVLKYAELVQKVGSECFDLPVSINRPNGDDQAVGFEFTSMHDYTNLQPKDQLELFVKEMFQALLSDRKERINVL